MNMFVKIDCISDHWNKILCLSLNLMILKINCLEQLQDEIGVILEVDPCQFFDVFFSYF